MQKSTPASNVNTAVSNKETHLSLEDRKKTELMNKQMELTFKVYKLNTPLQTFQEKHYLNLKNICQKLGNGNRSVKMVNDLLKVIFSTEDAANEAQNHER